MDGVRSTGSRCAGGRLLIATLFVVLGFSAHAAAAHAASRSIRVNFTNNSDSALTLTKAELNHGCWAAPGNECPSLTCTEQAGALKPPGKITIGESLAIESESCGVATGTEFHVAYKLANGTEMEMHYDVPFCSNVLCEHNNTCEESTAEGYELKREGCDGTNPVLTVKFRCTSTGCDGIPDEWKKNGVIINPQTGKPAPKECEGLLFCANFVNLPAMGVSLDRPNVLVQMDWMEETGGKKRNQQLAQASINRVIEAFNKDPVTYPGATRPGITLIVDNGPESTITPGGKQWGELSKAKAIPWEATFLTGTRETINSENFETLVKKDLVPSGRKPIFHYAVAASKLSAEAGCTSGFTPSAGTKKGFGFIVSLGGERKAGEPCWENEVGGANEQTGTFMHELGHALGLSHGGENDNTNFKPNYPSVMNYIYQTVGVPRNGERLFDYSEEGEPSLQEETLTEKGGISLGANPKKYAIEWFCPNGTKNFTAALGEVDWNCDKTIDAGEGFDVNGEQSKEEEEKNERKKLQELKGTKTSDWERIDFHTGGVGTGTAGENDVFPVTEATDELTPEIAARMRIQPAVSYTGALSGDYHDPVTASAKLVDPTTNNSPVVGVSIAFKLGSSASDACTATTNSSGAAACTITPTQAAGRYNIVASFAGNSTYQPANDTQVFTITPEETTMSYGGPTVILAGASGATLTANLVEDGSADDDSDGGSATPVPSESVTLAVGTQSCTGKTDASGNVSCVIPSVSVPLGPVFVGAAFAGDSYYAKSSASKSAIVFAFPSRGAFTLGNKTVAAATEATAVTFWADTWSSLNSLSGGSPPPAGKGFASVVSLPTSTPAASCGSNWTTSGGNSSSPPSGVPSYMGTLVTSKVTKSGSVIGGNTIGIVVVKTKAGYAPNPGGHGTGVIVAKYC